MSVHLSPTTRRSIAVIPESQPLLHRIEIGTSSLQGVSCARGLDWVDLNFERSTVCPILPGLMGIRQKRLGRWARWCNTEIKVNPTQVLEQMGHPVLWAECAHTNYDTRSADDIKVRRYSAGPAGAL